MVRDMSYAYCECVSCGKSVPTKRAWLCGDAKTRCIECHAKHSAKTSTVVDDAKTETKPEPKS